VSSEAATECRAASISLSTRIREMQETLHRVSRLFMAGDLSSYRLLV
jgi:hypothetical protein